ncbi:MAG: hypothetical protein ACRC3Y_05800, partial [Romboutsia sp.]|uniref:hypothetical protein n=1 Tax=Romboutsia sp. TaxID=1965302 RepID=UPI003F3FB56A
KTPEELSEEKQSDSVVSVDPNELSTDEFEGALFPEVVEPAVAESIGLNVDKVKHKNAEQQPEEVESNKDDTSDSKVSCSEKVIVEDKLRRLLINLHKKLSALGADSWDLSSINNLISYDGKLERISISKETANNIHLNSRTDNLSVALVNKKSSSDVLLIYKDEDNYKVNKYIETRQVDVSCEYREKDDFNNLKIKSN